MAGMDGLLCTEEALEDEDFGMLDRFMSGDALYDDLGIGHAAQESQWSSSTRSWGGSRLAELPCILHADEFKLRSAKPCNKRNEWHQMERSIVRWPRGRYGR